MKKLLKLTLASAMAFGLAACGGNDVELVDNYTNVFSSDIQSLDYVSTALAVDHEINANLVDGLVETNPLGEYVGALAESFEPNEDATVWTFKIREGVKWVTADGEEYAEVTAHDWVTGLQHAADFNSGTAYLVQGVIKNFSEYQNGLVDFSEVGVKAVDDYTLEYTLTKSTPYFHTICNYAILYPINQKFLESQGEGCKLGAPDKTACTFGTVDPTSILYNGAYILTENTSESKIELTANDAYWDTDNVHLKTVTWIFDDGSDPYSVINGFEAGTYAVAALQASWENFDEYLTKYADNYYQALPNTTVYYLNFNFNRQLYDHTSKTTDAEKENTQNAIQNADFRRALRAAYDRVSYMEVNYATEVATSMLRNMNGAYDLVFTTDGTPYGKLVEEAYKEMTGEEINLNDAQDPYLSKDAALAYIEEAKKAGVTFPVKLDLLVISDSSPVYIDQAQSFKKSIEDNTDGNIVIDLQHVTYNEALTIQYYNQDPAACDYDIMIFTGWGPDFNDPKTYCDIFSTSAGYYMTTQGLYLDSDNVAEDLAIKDKIGMDEYEALYQAAEAETDTDKRYAAYAKVDAYMVDQVYAIMVNMSSRPYRVTRVVPFTGAYALSGISEYKFKYFQVQADPVTVEQYNKAYDEWQKARGM